jgi:hypothetical protein
MWVHWIDYFTHTPKHDPVMSMHSSYVVELLTPVKSHILNWNLLYSYQIKCAKGSNTCLCFFNTSAPGWVVVLLRSLSCQMSWRSTSTSPIFIRLLKKPYWRYWLQVCTITLLHAYSFNDCPCFVKVGMLDCHQWKIAQYYVLRFASVLACVITADTAF